MGSCRLWRRLPARVYRLRVVGSIAISASYVAAGRFDALAAPAALPLGRRRRRPADRARGRGRISFGDSSPWRPAPLGLDARYPIAAAAGERGLAIARSRPVTGRY